MDDATQPPEKTDEGEPEPIKAFRGRGWFNIWGVLLGVFAGLLGFSVYRIFRLGFWGAVADDQFGYAAFSCVFVGICLIARWVIPGLLLERSSIDARSLNVLRDSRLGLYLRGRNRRW